MSDIIQPLEPQSNLVDQDRIRYPGSCSFFIGATPFGFFDQDVVFQRDITAATEWAARRLGFPVVDVELLAPNFFAAFEEAVNEWQSQVNQFNILNNLPIFQGQYIDNVGNASTQFVKGSNLPYVIQLSQAYGTEIGVGGYVDWKRGYINLVPGKQTYDLQELWGNVSESFNRIEIRRIFHDRPPAFARIYDPFSMTGMSYSNVLTELGFGAYSPAVQFLMCPIFEDLLRGQAIEFNDMVRKSAYSFEITNNKLKVFPIPTAEFRTYFDYTLAKDVYSGSLASPTVNKDGSINSIITDFSNVPYNNQPYSSLNDSARQWIRKYFLAICKEILGSIRQKVQTIPIPGGEITLDGAELRNEATAEKETLITQLREVLTEAGRRRQIEVSAQQTEQVMTALKGVPLMIYIF
jgi:hypothetical protein